MISSNIFWTFSVIIFFPTKLIHASYVESIIGGIRANEVDFKYQVAIIGLQNYSTEFNLIGGGAIIDDIFILSAARCFVDSSGELKNFTFLIAANAKDLKDLSRASIKQVDKIYIPNYTDIESINDIAVVKLKFRLHIYDNSPLQKLELPGLYEEFVGQLGIVTGYECNNLYYEAVNSLEKANSSFFLKFSPVRIVNDNPCREIYLPFTTDMQIYGLLETNPPHQHWGICQNDVGNPLVIGNKVIGIVSKVSVACDDAVYGTVFTNVAAFMFWIDLIVHNLPIDIDTVVLYNRNYLDN